MDELYAKRLPVVIRIQDHEDRKASIYISVEINHSSASLSRKELVIRLTDEKDPFFLFNLRLSEEDFQGLKVQQRLLVDFGAFPQKFIDLLELCLQEEHKEVPKFVLNLVCNGATLLSAANLNVIETNPFKHLTHLSLKFLPGTDADIKRYLADCLKTLKEQIATLIHRFEHTEADLNSQLRQAREALVSRTQELNSIKTDWTSKIDEINNRHNKEMILEKDRALQAQTSQQQKFDRDRRDLEQAHIKITKHLEARCQELESVNKDLIEFRYKSESTTRDHTSKLSVLDDENIRLKQEVQTLRKENASLLSANQEHERTLCQKRTRVAVLEQELKNKEELMQKTTDLHDTQQDFRKQMEEKLEEQAHEITKHLSNRKKLFSEVEKGNSIIKKCQAENKQLKTKLTQRTQVTVEQEKLLQLKHREVEKLKQDLEDLQKSLSQREDENRKLNEAQESSIQKLEESRHLLKTNEQMINWLSKQLTDLDVQRHTAFDSGSGGPTSTNFYRPSSTLQNTLGSSMQSSAYGQSPQTMATTRPPMSQFQGSSRISLATTSVAHSKDPAISRPLSTSVSQPKTTDAFLDPKYLQHGDDGLKTQTTTKTTSPLSQIPTRHGKDFHAPITNVSESQQNNSKPDSLVGRPKAPLMSSYFPTKAL